MKQPLPVSAVSAWLPASSLIGSIIVLSGLVALSLLIT
jgi:hypothetical protein